MLIAQVWTRLYMITLKKNFFSNISIWYWQPETLNLLIWKSRQSLKNKILQFLSSMVTVESTNFAKRHKYEWCVVLFCIAGGWWCWPTGCFYGWCEQRGELQLLYIWMNMLDSANSNLVFLNSSLFQTQNHFPWISPSVIYYCYFKLLLFEIIFCFFWEFEITWFNCTFKAFVWSVFFIENKKQHCSPFNIMQQVKKVNALDQKKRVGKAGKATVIHHVVTKTKKRVRHTVVSPVDLKF